MIDKREGSVGNEGLVTIGDARSEQSRRGGKSSRGNKELEQMLHETESTVTGMHLREGILGGVRLS
jgi:hypothetical protein